MSLLVAAGTHSGPAVATIVTAVKDAATAAAIVAGGLFTYFKFVRGRTTAPRAKLTLTGHTLAAAGPAAGIIGSAAVAVEVRLVNTGQIQLTLPADEQQLLTICSVSQATAFTGRDLSPVAASWKEPDAFFGQTDLLLDEGQPPSEQLRIEPGEEVTFAALFPVPAAPVAAAFLVSANCRVTYRSWMSTRSRWWDARMLVVPATAGHAVSRSEGVSS